MAEQANQKKGQQPEQDLNQLLKVRREKLAELQANGKDPFVITKYDQTAHSADISAFTFISAFLLISVIVCTVVTVGSLKASMENPVMSLKSE